MNEFYNEVINLMVKLFLVFEKMIDFFDLIIIDGFYIYRYKNEMIYVVILFKLVWIIIGLKVIFYLNDLGFF